MSAALVNLHANVRRHLQFFKGLRGNEVIVARRDDQGGNANSRNEREGRRLAVIVQRILETAAGGGEQVVELAHGQIRWKARQRRIEMMAGALFRESDHRTGAKA